MRLVQACLVVSSKEFVLLSIATSPDVLMDEPCSALDPIATAQVEELIDELRQNFCVDRDAFDAASSQSKSTHCILSFGKFSGIWAN